jgi:hypothetical protein
MRSTDGEDGNESWWYWMWKGPVAAPPFVPLGAMLQMWQCSWYAAMATTSCGTYAASIEEKRLCEVIYIYVKMYIIVIVYIYICVCMYVYQR